MLEHGINVISMLYIVVVKCLSTAHSTLMQLSSIVFFLPGADCAFPPDFPYRRNRMEIGNVLEKTGLNLTYIVSNIGPPLIRSFKVSVTQ